MRESASFFITRRTGDAHADLGLRYEHVRVCLSVACLDFNRWQESLCFLTCGQPQLSRLFLPPLDVYVCSRPVQDAYILIHRSSTN